MKETKHIFIINPVSGKGTGNAAAKRIEEICKKTGREYALRFTEPGPQTGKLDAGRVNGRYFLNTVCFGIDGQVANNIDRMRSRWIPASQRYTASIVYTFVTYREKPLEFVFSGQAHEMKSSVLTVCNGRFYGGGYKIAPDAKLSDGLMEMVYTDYIPRARLIPLLFKLKKGKP